MRQMISTRNGKHLCSRRDPILEAEAWVKMLNISKNIDHQPRNVAIIGLGAGFHVHALLKYLPKSEFKILEFDTDLIGIENVKNIDQVEIIFLKNENENEIENENDFVKKYLDIGRWADAVYGFRPAWSGEEKKYEDVFLTITNKEIIFNEKDKIWLTLRELVK